MTRARSLSLLANSNIFTVDQSNSRVGIGSTIPDVKLDVNGNMNVSGTLTYEDVTNVNTAGITTTGGLVVTGLGATIGGITTFFGDLNFGAAGVGGTVTTLGHGGFTGIVTALGFQASGVITATSFRGDGSELSGVDSSNLIDSGSTNRVAANTSGIVVTGIATVTGNIGVGGLTNPGALLSIPAGESNTPRLAIESAVDDNDFTITQYEDGNGTYTMLGQNVKLNVGGNTTVLDSGHKTAGILLDARSNGNITFYTGGDNASTEKLRIDSSGNVGINSTNPAYLLDIASGSASMRLNSTSTSTLVITSGASNAARIEFGDLANNDTGYIYYDNSDDSMQFATNGSNERLRITSGGQILLNGVTDKATTGTSATDLLMANSAAIRFRKGDDSAWINGVGLDSNNNLKLGWGGSVDEITFGISGLGDVLKIESDGDVVPITDNSYDLGSASLRWANIYSADLQLSNEGSSNDVDGTWGQYTIQEGENDLFLLNRRNGKKYRFMLEEV